MKDHPVHLEAVAASKAIRKASHWIVEVYIKVELQKVYEIYEYANAFTYMVQCLRHEENVVSTIRTLARKCLQVPELRKALRAQTLTVARANRIVSKITKDNARELIEFASTHTYREFEKKYRSKDDFKNMKLSEDTIAKAKHSANFHKCSVDEIINRLLTADIEKNDPVEKAKRAEKKKSAHADSAQRKSGRQPFAAADTHAINLKDERQCTWIHPDGERCMNTRYLARHHKIEVENGGTNDPTNVQTLCVEHHELIHQTTFTIAAWEPPRCRPTEAHAFSFASNALGLGSQEK